MLSRFTNTKSSGAGIRDRSDAEIRDQNHPWFGRLAERNERIWRQSRYRTPWQIAVGEELSEARIGQIIAEGTDFYDRPFTPRSNNE
ncbi:hypothetical protein [Nocardia sp. NBC_00416]|uniref:hypothetical protein n=1 Tax=Nocardia sp. NBC_00416 TaxID=2975991 RepID=UPI002E1F1F9A